MLAASFCTLYLKNGIFNIKRARRQGKLFWNSRLNNLIMILHFPWVWLVWKAMHFLLFTMATWSGHAAEPRIVFEWFRSTPKISRTIQRTYTVLVHITRHRVYDWWSISFIKYLLQNKWQILYTKKHTRNWKARNFLGNKTFQLFASNVMNLISTDFKLFLVIPNFTWKLRQRLLYYRLKENIFVKLKI